MEHSPEAPKRHLYCVERLWDVWPDFEFDQEGYERGQRFVDGLKMLEDAFAEVGDARKYSDFFTKVLNGGLMIVEPSFPLQRTVRKWGGVYEYMARPETTQSDEKLLIDHFRAFVGDDRKLLIEGISPMYQNYQDGPSIEEIATFEPYLHKIAIQPCAAEIFDSL